MPLRSALRAASLSTLLCTCAVVAAPLPGESYVVDGRCVSITRVQGGQATYQWSEGNASGSGSLPADWLVTRCDARAPRLPSAAETKKPTAKPPAETTGHGDSAPRVSASAGTDTDFARQILRAHNGYRCMHGVPPLQWNNDIAAYAQRWIERSGFHHSDSYRSPLGPMGENLYSSSRQPAGPDAAASWYSESGGYDYRREGSPGTGHFTAMIWKDAKFLGCGRSGGVVSCNYAPESRAMDCKVPNMRGCYVEQVLPVSKNAQSCENAQ